MSKMEIYDPAMCCSTGVCGPSVNPEPDPGCFRDRESENEWH